MKLSVALPNSACPAATLRTLLSGDPSPNAQADSRRPTRCITDIPFHPTIIPKDLRRHSPVYSSPGTGSFTMVSLARHPQLPRILRPVVVGRLGTLGARYTVGVHPHSEVELHRVYRQWGPSRHSRRCALPSAALLAHLHLHLDEDANGISPLQIGSWDLVRIEAPVRFLTARAQESSPPEGVLKRQF